MHCKTDIIILIFAVGFFFGFLPSRISSQSGIPIVPLYFQRDLESKYGLGWPHNLTVAVGHEALMKLTRSVDNQLSCSVTTTIGVTFSVTTPPNSRYEIWGSGCGVKIKNITHADEGHWRLTSVSANHNVTGFIAVHVTDPVSAYTVPPIALEDGSINTHVILTNLDNQYCMVAQPFAQSSLVPGQCQVILERTSRAVQGTWDMHLGLPGQVSEVHIERTVAVDAEHLDVGFEHDTVANKLNLYCNILHARRNITFCRFQRTSQNYGYNLIDGISDGVHSYYGDGFMVKHCGITLERVTPDDFGTWRCSVGVQQYGQPMTSMQALISVTAHTTSSRKIRAYQGLLREENEERNIFVQNDNILTIDCQAHESLSYCWFQHPNGTQYTPGEKVNDEQIYWYSGESFQLGDCSMSFAKVTENESGLWTCHMGSRNTPGVEITQNFNVRVTGALAANQLEVTAYNGESTILQCQTSGGRRPLNYCRFLSPSNLGINIDSSVTFSEPISERFYFTEGLSLDYGDCSLTIISAQDEDQGSWTCGAVIAGETAEARDYIELTVMPSRQPRSRAAAVAGVVTGLIVVIVLLGVFVLVKRKMFCFSRLNTPSTIRIPTLSELSLPRNSGNSEDSNNSSANSANNLVLSANSAV